MRKIEAIIGIALLASAAAFAADAPTLDGVAAQIAQLKTYAPGQSQALLNDLQRTTVELAKEPAGRAKVAEALAALLQDDKATMAARHFACRQLQSVGTEAQIPLLVGLLTHADLGDLARGALECIPGDAALKALRDAVGTLKGAARIGAVNSLGLRRDAAAVRLIEGLLAENDAPTTTAVWTALSRIATPEAAGALLNAKATAPALTVLHDAQLRCATRLADAGSNEPAASIYRAVWSSDRPITWRLSALAGLVRVDGEKATPNVLEALDSADPLSQPLAMRLARQLPGAQMTSALVQRLAKLDANGQVLMLDVLAERGDKTAAEAVRKLAEGSDDAVRAAAFRALIRLADPNAVAWLTQRAAAEKGVAQQAARECLAKLSVDGVDDQLMVLIERKDLAPRIEAIRALAARKTIRAATPILKQCKDEPQGPAFKILLPTAGTLSATPELYQTLLDIVKLRVDAETSDLMEACLLSSAAQLQNPTDRTTPVLAALKDASPPVHVVLLRVLGSLGGADSIAAIREHLAHADASVKDAAIRALAGTSDASVAPDLLALAQKAESPVHRVLALRGYLRLAAATEDGAKRLKMLEELRPIATTPDLKKMLLGGLSDVPDAGALQMVVSFLDDADVKTEAGMAVLKIGAALVKKDRAAVASAAAALVEKSPDATIKDRAKDLLAQAERGGKGRPTGPKPENKRAEELKAEKAKQAPQGFKLVSYIDCGPETADGVKDGPALRLTSAESYTWDDAANVAPARFGTIAYDGEQVVFNATGLNPKKQYRLGFSWWDYDHDDREASVWAATGQGQRETKLLGKTALPSHAGRSEKPAEKTLDLPRELQADGRMRISFRKEGGANVVVSEVWLYESDAEGAALPNTQATAPAQETEPAAQPTNPNAEARVLILTGIEYHNWKETAPALAELLRKDTRLEVKVVEDPAFLASPDLKKFNVIVLNYMNWEKPDPGDAARANLKAAVEGGTGLVLVHFACGAFQGWPEFVKIAGRVWNPKLRGHDPFGKFTVDIAKTDHPITKGLEAFETTDELYTCLDGDTPIEILVKATSKVDKKDYPMVFVLNYGKGRVVHNVLGHDVKAIVNPPVAELYRRGTAWAAGLK